MTFISFKNCAIFKKKLDTITKEKGHPFFFKLPYLSMQLTPLHNVTDVAKDFLTFHIVTQLSVMDYQKSKIKCRAGLGSIHQFLIGWRQI